MPHLPLPLVEPWSVRLAPGAPHLVVPDGCIDLVFRGGPEPALLWVGPMTRAEVVTVDAPATYAGLRLRPGAAPALAGVDPRALLDGALPVHDEALVAALAGARTDGLRRRLLLDHAARLVAGEPDALVARVAAIIVATREEVRVSALARQAGVSERTLHRRFVAAVGHGPKRLARVARLGRARRLASQGLRGAELAAEAGYFDQAHLCHELADFGLTAAAFAGP